MLLTLSIGVNDLKSQNPTLLAFNSSDDSLTSYIQEANRLWGSGNTNLQLSFNLLSQTSTDQSHIYGRLATNFYLNSLKNASFKTETGAIHNELERLKPLVSDSTQNRWDNYFEEENPQLLNEMIGFWQINDPYSSTAINERLIEHWRRINYARSNFNNNKNSVYGTDERGVYYVRLGSPDKVIKKSIHLNGVIDPVSYKYLAFDLGNIVKTNAEIWEYKVADENYVYIFGKKGGYGEYGARKDVMELIDTQGLGIQFDGTYWLNSSKMRRFAERVAQVGLYQELAPYHPFFDRMYQELESSLVSSHKSYVYMPEGNSFISPDESDIITRYLDSSFIAEALAQMKYYEQKYQAPRNRTSQKTENEYLGLQTRISKFLDRENENEFLLSVKSTPERKIENYTSHFLSNNLFRYDKNWNLTANIDDLKKVDEKNIGAPSLYQISDSVTQSNIYFSSELIDTTRKNIALPGKVNPKTSAIISSSGKQKISFPEPLSSSNKFLVSDIVIGNQQKENNDARIPIIPSVEYRFQKDSKLMIYFEAYNVPEGGYKFTYFFKKDRWLLSHKNVEQSQVTILADKVEGRDKQFFMIDLDDLEPDSYQLHWQFTPINSQSETNSIKKKIELLVVE